MTPMMPHTCDTCAHSIVGSVQVGDRWSDRIEDWACEVEDLLTDDDCDGECHLYTPRDFDAESAEEEALLRDMMEREK